MLPFITHEHSSLPPLSPPALRLADNGNPINHSNPRRLGGKQQQNTRSFRKTSTTLSLTSRLSLIFLVLAVYIFDAAHAGAGDLHNSMDLHSNMPISPDELSLDPGFFHPHGLVRRAKTTTSSKPASASTSASSSPTSAAEITFDNPTAFDSISLTQNLTSSCGNFLSYIVADTTFKNCLPLSGLIRDSSGFFQIMKKGAFATTEILDRACSTDLPTCTDLLQNFGGQVLQPQYCGADYKKGNPVVSNFYTALIGFRPLYTAGCLKDSVGAYCFVDAVMSTVSSDLFIYSLPIGSPLPGGSRTRCTDCLQRTMSIFKAFADNRTQSLATTYIPAAEQINMGCGPNFIDPIVTFQSAASSAFLASHVLTSALAAVFAVFILAV